jgi:hypothetical protein
LHVALRYHNKLIFLISIILWVEDNIIEKINIFFQMQASPLPSHGDGLVEIEKYIYFF